MAFYFNNLRLLTCFTILMLAISWLVVGSPPAHSAGNPSSGALNIHVNNNRWPDTSSLKKFGEDTAKIMNAATNEEKALALFRFIQQTTMVISNVPSEPAYNDDYIDNPEKLLNVYGSHWCDGLSRIMQSVWRAMGYRAQKLYKFGHTLADIHYMDEDGIERWHVFDNSAYHWFLWDRTGTHIATPEELILDHSLYKQPSKTLVPEQTSPPIPSYIHESHLKFLDYSNHFNLRNGERVTFYWSNIGKPYYVPNGYDVDGIDFEHGPYEKTYGNAVWAYQPDLSKASYKDGLHTDPVNIRSAEEDGLQPNLHPSNPGAVGSVIYHFSYPYIISDALIDARFIRNTAADVIRLYISNDGQNWKNVWSTGSTGQINLVEFSINEKFNIEENYPSGLITPFGHYDYYLKIEMTAAQDISNCGIDHISITNVTQHNIFSLPQLWPVKNQITVSGNIAFGTSLKITYRWDDLQGQRENIALVENAPFTYEILADGTKWEQVISKSLTIEAISRVDEGNKILKKEGPPQNTQDISPEDAFLTTEIVGRWQVPPLQNTAKYIQDITEGLQTDDFVRIHEALSALSVEKDPASKQAILDVIYHDTSYKYYTKYWALQALYQTIGTEAAPVMIDVLERDSAIGYRDTTGEFDADTNWLWNCSIAAFILSDIDNAEARNAISLVTDLLDTHKLQARLNGRDPFTTYRWTEIRWGLIRVVGILGDSDEVSTLVTEIDKEWTGESSYNAIQALGNIGDGSVLPVILDFMDRSIRQGSNRMKVLYSIEAIGKLGDQSNAPKLYPFLTDWDENFRGYTTTALGKLGNKEAIPHLEKLLQTETFPWVIQAAQESLAELRSGGNSSFVDVPEEHWAYDYIEILYQQGFIAGCSASPLMYCPDDPMTRAQAAVFVLRGQYGGGYMPPEATSQIFDDTPMEEWYGKWVNKLSEDGFTSGCSANPPGFCPLLPHTIAEASVFFVRMKHNPYFYPPDPEHIFSDIPSGAWYERWVEQAYRDRILLPCQTEPKLLACAEELIKRDMAAYMTVQAKELIPQESGIFVDNSVPNSGDGSLNAPYKTISEALAIVQPGNTIYVRGDSQGRVYSETLTFPVAGIPSAPITLRAHPNEKVIITSSSRIFRLDQPYWRFEYLIFDHQGGAGDAIQIRGGHFAIFNHVEIRNGQKYGIQIFDGNNVLIENSIIHSFDTGVPGNDAHCLCTDPTNSAYTVENLQLLNNIIYDCSGDGIQFYAEDSTPVSEYARNILLQGNTFYKNPGFYGENAIDSKGAEYVRVIENEIYGFDSNKAVVLQKGSSHFLFEGNIIHDSHRGIEMRGKGGKSQSDHVLVRNIFYNIYGEYVIKFDDVQNGVVQNNTVAENNAEFLRIEEEGLIDGDIRNNLIYATGSPKISGTLQAEVGYNGWFSSTAGILSRETDTIGTDPLFQDLPGKDFRLQPGSLAIDAGMDIGYPYQQKAPDLGADEYRP